METPKVVLYVGDMQCQVPDAVREEVRRLYGMNVNIIIVCGSLSDACKRMRPIAIAHQTTVRPI